MSNGTGRSVCLAVSCVCAFLPNSRSRSKIFHQTIASSVPPFKTRCRDQSQLIDVLVIRLRVEYFLLGDGQICELMLHRDSLTALVMHGAAVHSMYCLIIAFIPAVNTTNISGPCCCYYVGAEFYVVVCP